MLNLVLRPQQLINPLINIPLKVYGPGMRSKESILKRLHIRQHLPVPLRTKIPGTDHLVEKFLRRVICIPIIGIFVATARPS